MTVEVPALGCENIERDIVRHNGYDAQRNVILGVLKSFYFPVCDRSVAEVTGYSVNIVTARRNELVSVGLVEFAFKARSPFSRVRVKHWRSAR